MRTCLRPLAHALRLAALLLPAPIAWPAQFSVDRFNDAVDASPGDGVCAAADAGCSLRAAIQEANALPGADTIQLAAGTFLLSIAGSAEDAGATGDLDVVDDLSLVGAGADATVVDAGAMDRVLDLLAPASGTRTAMVRALTLRNGRLGTTSAGGGAWLRVGIAVQVDLQDVTIRDNVSPTFVDAVGISNRGCITGRRVRLLDNQDPAGPGSMNARAGGIMTSGADSCLDLVDSELRGNRGDFAGAIYADGGAPVTLRRSLVAANEARFSSALLLNNQNTVLLENVTLSGNRGNGAVLVDGGATLTLVHCTVTGNTGIAHIHPVVGGIQDVHGGFGRTFLSNTILSGNGPGSLANDCRTAISQGGGNLLGDSARCQHQMGPTDQLDVDPGLSPLADHGGVTHTHLPGANARDRGQDAACLSVDQRGIARPLDGDGDGQARCDVGAAELVIEPIFADGFEPPQTINR